MRCSICHKHKPTVAILMPTARHEMRVCFTCLYEHFLEWSDYKESGEQ